MAAFEVFCSNHPRVLVQLAMHRLLEAQAGLAADDLRSLPVLVPTVSARDRLRDDLAEVGGVCAGLDFVLPSEFADRWLPRHLGLPVPGFDAEVARWRVCAALVDTDGLHLPADTAWDARRLALADRICDTLLRLDAWARERSTGCWREGRAAPVDATHPFLRPCWSALTAAGDPTGAHRALVAKVGTAGDLPPLVLAFGTLDLSPPLLELLAALGQRTVVQVLLQQPVPGDWSDHGLVWCAGGGADKPWSHPLLARWGIEQRQALRRYDMAGAEVVSERGYFVLDEDDRLLTRLRAGLTQGGVPPPAVPAPDDGSVVVQYTSGRRAEVEALKHRLAVWFAADRDLAPHRVAIACPDPADYAPMLAAIFDAAGEGPGLPVDLRPDSLAADPATAVAMALLELLPGRWRAGEVLALLHREPVASAWSLDPHHLRTIADWCDRADLRFGVDAAHRGELGLAVDAAATWRRGLERLVWSRFLGDETGAVPLRGGVAPVEGLDEDDAGMVDLLAGLLLPLLEAAAEWRRPRPASWWAGELPRLVAHLRRDDGDQYHAALVQRLHDWADEMAAAGQDAAPVTADLVGARLDPVRRIAPLRLGGIAVGTVESLRGHAWEALCLIGMDDGAFPRSPVGDDVDPLRQEPVPGLPDPRTQGRGALLDLVAGTTRHLLVSWTGSDPHTGEYLSPCPAVGDLLEVLSAQTGVPVRDLVQPIGLDQVPPGPWPSPARRAQSQARRTPLPDASALVPPAPLPPPGQSWCGIDEIFRDLADPPTAWLRRLGIRLEEVTDPPADHERLRLDDGLENWRLRDAIVQARRDARDLEELLDRWEAEGSIPRRAWGRGKVATLVRQADRLVEGTADLWRQVRQEPRGLTLPVGGMTVSGVIARHHPEHGPVLQHAGAGGARFRLRVWLQGLCWQAAGHRGGGLLLALDQRKERCVPVDLPAADSPIEAAERLGRVLDCWRQIRSRPRPWPAEVLSAWADGEDDDPAVRDAQARIAWMKGGSGGWSQGPAGQPAAVRLWPEGEDAWTHAAIELADYAESMGVWQWSRSPRSPAPDDAGQAAPAARSAPAKKRKAR